VNRIPYGPLIKFTALTVVVALATTVLALTIANASPGEHTAYTARFTDASGLLPGDDVRIAGVVVGTVDDIRIVDRRVAEVAFSVSRDQRLPASVTGAILYKNLIGQRFLSLALGAGPTGDTLPPGGTIPVERTRPPLNLTTLFNGFKPLFAALDPQQVNQLSFEIVQVLQGQGGTVQSLLASTSSLTNTLADRDEVIGQVIDNLNAVLDTINGRGDHLSTLITTLRQLVSGLAGDRTSIGNAISALDDLAGVTTDLLQEGRAPLKQDIAQLGRLSTNLNDDSPTIEAFLRTLPVKMAAIGRIGSYGSWMNFYMCEASVTGVTYKQYPGESRPAPTGVHPDAARCGS
jgi:phospholipid/cholesterol/gamma-HCH transport system substrate-binding protein